MPKQIYGNSIHLTYPALNPPKMPREVESSLNERQFFTRALQDNIRLDGRSFDQFRPLELEFGDQYGVADVRLGKTRYLLFLLFYIST